MNISARNIFKGTVSSIVKGAVNAEVTITLASGAPIVSIITIGAVERLGLQEGMASSAIIKASTIILGANLHEAKMSARNILCGTVTRVIDGPVSCEVDLEIGGGEVLSAVITHGSAKNLGFAEGDHACAIFKASSVIIGVE
ncbi:transporter [Chlorobaculum sp. 24CR]|uniref:TOBE domain-containing protein n=1 Tax=Chlorobaculum sp. 24CR TaxID=2508878 RepID=UPI00100B3E34|nr:TOBE domain-containing protein [Chlorobaculum sp. 24CR]RXK84333.1 transporter [Chlorobaculum sp. 24CR]